MKKQLKISMMQVQQHSTIKYSIIYIQFSKRQNIFLKHRTQECSFRINSNPFYATNRMEPTCGHNPNHLAEGSPTALHCTGLHCHLNSYYSAQHSKMHIYLLCQQFQKHQKVSQYSYQHCLQCRVFFGNSLRKIFSVTYQSESVRM